KATDLKATLDANLAQLLHTVSVPGITATSGDAKFDGHIVQNANAQSLNGRFTLSNFSGTYKKSPIDRLAAHAEADLAINGSDVTVTNLIVRDPNQSSTNAPLSARFALDGSLKQNVLELKKCRIALSPTQRAKNEFDLTGQVDMSKSNLVANITAQADALDVTD